MDESLSPEEAREFWFGLIDYERRVPAPGDLRLNRMRHLLRLLGDPQQRLRIVHVAGSKGKGSTAAMTSSVLRQAGYRTGLFTSPHLCQVEERFQVNGEPISTPELTALLNDIRKVLQHAASEEIPTFFEVATALGFLHFLRRRVDVAIVEVGLGGRLDSTNVCQPLVTLITSISHDHTRLLGDRLRAIAREKAGIIKPGKPCISGVTLSEPREVIEEVCRQRKAPLDQLGVDFTYQYTPARVLRNETIPPRVQVTNLRGTSVHTSFQLNLLGEHQAANAAVVVGCVQRLRQVGFHIPEEALARGLAQVDWPARLEVMHRQPLVVLDCAHNVASAQALVDTLRVSFPQPRKAWLVFAGSGDKDLAGMFRVLADWFHHAFLTRTTNNTRGLASRELAEIVRSTTSLSTSLHPSPAEAYREAWAHAHPDDLICITGSVFLAGELRPILLAQNSQHRDPLAPPLAPPG